MCSERAVSISEEYHSQEALLPYVKGITDKIGSVLQKHGIRTIFELQRKIAQLLRSIEDKIPLHTEGIYSRPCSCRQDV